MLTRLLRGLSSSRIRYSSMRDLRVFEPLGVCGIVRLCSLAFFTDSVFFHAGSQDTLATAESSLSGLRASLTSQQDARATAEQKLCLAIEELKKVQDEFVAFKKTSAAEQAALVKHAKDADERLKVISEELNTLKGHIFRMTSDIFGQRSRQLSSDSVLSLKVVYTLTEQLYNGTLCTIKSILPEKSVPKLMKGVHELLSTLPKQIGELRISSTRRGAMATLSWCFAFAPELIPEEMMDGFPSKKDDGYLFTDTDYATCVRPSRVLASTLVNETDLTPSQAAYDAEGKRIRCPTFEAKTFVPVRHRGKGRPGAR